MPPRDPSAIQLDFPLLTADLIDQLNLVGTLGLLNFLPEVRPTFIIGSRGLRVAAERPVFTSTQVFSGSVLTPAIGTVIATTGPLPAGDYDLMVEMQLGGNFAAAGLYQCQHRNAADAATLAVLLEIPQDGSVSNYMTGDLPLVGYRIAENERIRVIITVLGGGRFSAQIYARIRPVP